jgi:hypothetical protein
MGRSSDGHMWIACESKGCGIAETYMSKHHDALLAMWNRRTATALTAQAERIAGLQAALDAAEKKLAEYKEAHYLVTVQAEAAERALADAKAEAVVNSAMAETEAEDDLTISRQEYLQRKEARRDAAAAYKASRTGEEEEAGSYGL